MGGRTSRRTGRQEESPRGILKWGRQERPCLYDPAFDGTDHPVANNSTDPHKGRRDLDLRASHTKPSNSVSDNLKRGFGVEQAARVSELGETQPKLLDWGRSPKFEVPAAFGGPHGGLVPHRRSMRHRMGRQEGVKGWVVKTGPLLATPPDKRTSGSKFGGGGSRNQTT